VSSLATLLVAKTRAAFYDAGLAIATALGLPVESWATGDPTRSLYHIVAEALEEFETVVAAMIAAGFLSYATGEWLILLAYELFGVVAVSATYASASDYILTNTGGAVYDFDAGDITLKSDDGFTYRNTTGGHLASGPGTTLVISIVADVAGSDSSALAGEITELVTDYLGVTGTNPTALVGLDAESEASIRQRCRDKLASLSPNGAADAYAYVSRNPDLTGITSVTRTRTIPDSDTGLVTHYVAGASGALSGPDVAAVQAAILTWCTPLCITPTVVSASNATFNITYTVKIYNTVNLTDTQIKAGIATVLAAMFKERPISGDGWTPSTAGKMYVSLIEAAIRSAYPEHIFSIVVSSPASDTTLAVSDVPVLGTITGTVQQVAP